MLAHCQQFVLVVLGRILALCSVVICICRLLLPPSTWQSLTLTSYLVKEVASANTQLAVPPCCNAKAAAGQSITGTSKKALNSAAQLLWQNRKDAPALRSVVLPFDHVSC